MPLEVVVLAAGQGKRMRSALPKVLHPLGGRPLLAYVLDTARELGARKTIVVHGHGADAVRAAFANTDVQWVLQPEQLGTGHAVQQALPHVGKDAQVLILYGDVPLVRLATLKRLLEAAGDALAITTAELGDPRGYGRIVRDRAERVERIVEEKDASAAERAIREINAGLMALPGRRLGGWLSAIGNRNAQKEYYLTDVVSLALRDGVAVHAVKVEDAIEVAGVNSKRELALLERELQRRHAERLLEEGVSLADPARLDVRGMLACGADVSIDVNCVFEGRVSLGDRVRIAANCVLRNVSIGADTEVLPFSHLEDSEIGARVNVGAGTITCNYDGAAKHRTIIEDDCFIGSDTTLVAPVRVAKGSYIGAGSTINKDTPAGQLTVARARQVSIPGWKPPKKS